MWRIYHQSVNMVSVEEVGCRREESVLFLFLDESSKVQKTDLLKNINTIHSSSPLPLRAQTPAVIRFLEKIFHAWTHTVSCNWAEEQCTFVLFGSFSVFFLWWDIFLLFPHNTKQQRKRYRKHNHESPYRCCSPVSVSVEDHLLSVLAGGRSHCCASLGWGWGGGRCKMSPGLKEQPT